MRGELPKPHLLTAARAPPGSLVGEAGLGGTDSNAGVGAALSGRSSPAAHDLLMAEYDGGSHACIATLSGAVDERPAGQGLEA